MRPWLRHIMLLLWMLLGICSCRVMAQSQSSPIILSSDRTILYPSRMELQGDESILDLLLSYPELLVKGFDQLLDNYQLRMENVPMSCNLRIFLSTTPARVVEKIQICHNPGVAKGITGLGGVIDLTMQRGNDPNNALQPITLPSPTAMLSNNNLATDATPKAEGRLGFETSTKGYMLPYAVVYYGSESTDVIVNASLNTLNANRQHATDQYADIFITHRFDHRNRLLVYLRQSYAEQLGSNNLWNRSYLARARYFHTFNDRGTELLMLAGYRFDDATFRSHPRDNVVTNGTQLYLLELNTPLASGLNMMLGWEADLSHRRYSLRQTMVSTDRPFAANDDYTIINNDFYLELNYSIGPLKLWMGDRLSAYYYQYLTPQGSASSRPLRNFAQAALIYTPNNQHQLMAAYYRRFVNPYYLHTALNRYPQTDGIGWTQGNPLLHEQLADIVRIAYTFSKRHYSFNASSQYLNTYGVVSTVVTPSYLTWTNDPTPHQEWQLDASTAYRSRRWSLVAGGHLCYLASGSYGYFRLAPKILLPHQWQFDAQAIYCTTLAPERQIDNTPLYVLLQVRKSIGDRLQLSIQCHDPFNDQRRTAVADIQYRF